ncbi:hypothetical protein [Desulfonatronum thiosulfatophilum]|uniref:hypothetical protein n=1 Tax=Desulfonatronum thiosulfatophilum TaxID=617002 RepID=UPI0011142F87|nr:hypothetical protein [Desulfonatronum thiosulfatophilum]
MKTMNSGLSGGLRRPESPEYGSSRVKATHGESWRHTAALVQMPFVVALENDFRNSLTLIFVISTYLLPGFIHVIMEFSLLSCKNN